MAREYRPDWLPAHWHLAWAGLFREDGLLVENGCDFANAVARPMFYPCVWAGDRFDGTELVDEEATIELAALNVIGAVVEADHRWPLREALPRKSWPMFRPAPRRTKASS